MNPSVLSAIAFFAGVSTTFAHVTLETKQATIKSSYKAVLRAPHGCEGSPMLRLRVQIPEGYIGVKPMPKAGWTLDIVRGEATTPAQASHGGQASAAVKEVAWSGRLPDDQYDEFVLTGSIAAVVAPGATLYFKVVQECEKGVNRWIEIPAAGQPLGDLTQPAPALKIVAPAP
jgi:uncharacterized protein YcnI